MATARTRPRTRSETGAGSPAGGTGFIEPGSPWQNPYIESLNSCLRDELLGVEQFATLAGAKVLIADWQEDYNHRRPHSALGWLAPVMFAAAHAANALAGDGNPG